MQGNNERSLIVRVLRRGGGGGKSKASQQFPKTAKSSLS
jgi:hypothetical protein